MMNNKTREEKGVVDRKVAVRLGTLTILIADRTDQNAVLTITYVN